MFKCKEIVLMLLYCCYGTIMRQWYALGLKFSNVHACFWKLESVCLALNECRFFHYSCLFSVPCTHGTCGAGYGFANCLHCSSEQSQRRCGCWQGCKVCCQRKATISRSVEWMLGLVYFFLLLIMPAKSGGLAGWAEGHTYILPWIQCAILSHTKRPRFADGGRNCLLWVTTSTGTSGRRSSIWQGTWHARNSFLAVALPKPDSIASETALSWQ